MLHHLSIKNYALIDDVEISFESGLNLITGETGAGKSIILGAISLILGQRSESKYFYSQHKKCIVEGHFDIRKYNMRPFFNENDLDYENITILRREIHNEGRSRAFINDSPVTLNIMKQLAEQLIEIHSQHAVLELNKESFQLSILDALANNDSLLDEYKTVFKTLQKEKAALSQLKQHASKAQTEIDYQEFLFNELSQAAMKNGEQEMLEIELARLTHAEDIKKNLHDSRHLLEEIEPSVLSILTEVRQFVSEVKPFDPQLEAIHERISSCHIELKDISSELSTIAENTLVDQEQLQIIRDRIDLIFRLQQKHQVSTISELLDIRQELDAQLQAAQNYDEQILRLAESIKLSEEKATYMATKLSTSRRKIVAPLQEQVAANLASLGMRNAQFLVQIDQNTDNVLTISGVDRVSFLFSANAGQAPREVAKVASGGELSRLMLTLKSLVATRKALPSIIFDEIDTGISGKIALKVGESMETLSKNMQVIAITHLPQIAAKGHTHFKVSKEDKNQRSITRLTKLTEKQRLNEIAELLGGTDIGETALDHAKELLKR